MNAEGFRDCEIHAPAAGALHLRGVLCAGPHGCPCDRVSRYQIVRAAVDVLQGIAPVFEYLVSTVVIGPTVADARWLHYPQRLARSETENAGKLPAAEHFPENVCAARQPRDVIDGRADDAMADLVGQRRPVDVRVEEVLCLE